MGEGGKGGERREEGGERVEVAYQLRDVVIIVADDLAFSSQYLPSAVW